MARSISPEEAPNVPSELIALQRMCEQGTTVQLRLMPRQVQALVFAGATDTVKDLALAVEKALDNGITNYVAIHGAGKRRPRKKNS